MNITLEEVEVFLAVVDTGSLTGAAQQLAQPVSSISRILARLEDKLGTTLLFRTTRRLSLTDEGCSFLRDARDIVAAVQAAQQRLQLRHGQPSGPLRIDAATPFMLHAVLPLIGGYRQRYPLVTLELTSNEGIVDLLERRIDLAIRIGDLRDSSLHSRLLCSTRLRVLASPTYLEAHGAPTNVAALRSHALLGFSQPQTLNTWPLQHADGKPVHIQPALAASSGEVLRQLALAGQGIACLGDFMTAHDLARGDLIELLAGENLRTTRPIHAVYYRHSAVSARITSFLDYLSEQLRLQPWAVTARQGPRRVSKSGH